MALLELDYRVESVQWKSNKTSLIHRNGSEVSHPKKPAVGLKQFLLNRLQRSEQRLLFSVSAVWLIVLLLIIGGIFYIINVTPQTNMLLLIGWVVLLSGVAIWLTARLLSPYVPSPSPIPSENVEPPTDKRAADLSLESVPAHWWDTAELQIIKQTFQQQAGIECDGLLIHEKVKILGIDPTLASLLGYSLTELVGLTILDLATPESHSVLLRNILLKYEKPYKIIGLQKSGNTLPIEVLSRPIAHQGTIVRVMALRKIIERDQHEVQRELQKAKQELETSLDKGTTQLRFSNERLRLELYERERMEAELKVRARQQAAVAELGQRALVGTGLSVLFDEAALLVTQTLQIEFCAVLEFLSNENAFLLRAGTGWPEALVDQVKIPAGMDSQAGYTLISKRAIIVENLRSETRFKSAPLFNQHNIISGMSAIIQSKNKPFGVLGAYTVNLRTFTEDDIHFLQAIANVLASAIETAQLFEKTQAALEETAVLYRVAQTLAQIDSEQEMFEFVLTQYLQHLNLHQGGVLIIDDDKAFGTLKAHMVDGKLVEPGLRIPVVGNPSYDQLMENEEPVIIRDVLTDKLIGSARQLSIELGIKSLLLVPIIFRGAVIGALGADSTDEIREFTTQEIALAKAMANQLGIAIENMRLHVETGRRAEQLAVLHELDRAITTSLRLDDIHFAVARHTSRLLAYDRLSIALRDNDDMQVTYVGYGGDDKSSLLTVGDVLPQQTSAIGWVATQGQPLLRHNIATDAHYVEDEQLISSGLRSTMIIPLRIKGRVIGTFNLGSRQIGAYSPDDIEIAQAIADQLTVAIENARLFQQAQQEISERKRAEAALEEERALLAQRVEERTLDLQTANLELARAARLKDEFLASMSHELRTPLTAILGLCDVLKMEVYGPLSEKQSKAINDIEDSGRHLQALINDILDLSKIEAGKLELQFMPVLIQALCQTSLQFIKQAAHKKKISLSLDIDDNVSMLQADDRRLKQILVNLLSNAVKFTPEGGSVGLEVQGDSQKQQIDFTVWDTGIGIAKEDMSRLFEPFVQLDSSLTRQYPGTGLGLALVRRMVKLHGGNTQVESEVGRGSRFTVSFPWVDRPAPKKQPVKTEGLSTARLNSKQTDETAPPTHSASILVAEDDIMLSVVLTDYLRAKGYTVIEARNGIQAIERTKQENPDIILMDIQMPQMDGLEATRHLRTKEGVTIPIIVLTALAMAGDRERCLEAGADTYLTKPINFDLLVETIQIQLINSERKKSDR